MSDPARKSINLDAVIVDVSSERPRQVREVAAHANMLEAERADSPLSVPERVWKHNLFREYYRQKEIAVAREKVNKATDVVRSPGLEDDAAADQRAVEAILHRFAQQEAEYIHDAAGERKTLVTDTRFRTQIENLIRSYVRYNMTDDAFEAEKKKFLALIPGVAKDAIDSGEIFADNLLACAKEVRAVVDAGTSLDLIDFNTEITIGRARLGARTETEINQVDRVMEKLNRTPLKPLQRPIGQALGLAASLLAFTPMGQSERERVVMERRQHVRDRAAGLEFDPRDTRRAELERTRYPSISADTLAQDIYTVLDISQSPAQLRDATSFQAFARLVDAKARLDALTNISDRLHIDLIDYPDGEIENGRADLDAASVRAREALRNISPANIEKWTGSNTPDALDAYLSAAFHVIETEFLTETREETQRSIGTLRRASFGARRPIGPALSPDEAEQRRQRQAAAATPPPAPARPRPTPPVATPPPGALPRPVDAPPARHEAAVAPAETEPQTQETLAQRFRREFGAGFSRFSAETGYLFGPVTANHAERQRIFRGELEALLAPPNPASIEDLIRLTGEDFEEAALDLYQTSKNIAVLEAIMRVHPERAARIPWARALNRIQTDIVGHESNPHEDVWWNTLYPLAANEGELSFTDAEDGERFADFLRGFGPLALPENLKAFLAWDAARAKGEDLPGLEASIREDLIEIFGEDALKLDRQGLRIEAQRILQEKTEALLNGESLSASRNELEKEWNTAIEARLGEIGRQKELRESVTKLGEMLQISEQEPAAIVKRFEEEKAAFSDRLKKQVSAWEARKSGADDAREIAQMTRLLTRAQEAQRTLTLVTLTEDPATWELALQQASEISVEDVAWDKMVGAFFLTIHRTERLAAARSALAAEQPNADTKTIEETVNRAGSDIVEAKFAAEDGAIPPEWADRLIASTGFSFLREDIDRIGWGTTPEQINLHRQLLRSFDFTLGGKHPLVVMSRQMADVGQYARGDFPDFLPSREVMSAFVHEGNQSALDQADELMRRFWFIRATPKHMLDEGIYLKLCVISGTAHQMQELEKKGRIDEAYLLLERIDAIQEDVTETIQAEEARMAAARKTIEEAAAAKAAAKAAGTAAPAAAAKPGATKPAGTTTGSVPVPGTPGGIGLGKVKPSAPPVAGTPAASTTTPVTAASTPVKAGAIGLGKVKQSTPTAVSSAPATPDAASEAAKQAELAKQAEINVRIPVLRTEVIAALDALDALGVDTKDLRKELTEADNTYQAAVNAVAVSEANENQLKEILAAAAKKPAVVTPTPVPPAASPSTSKPAIGLGPVRAPSASTTPAPAAPEKKPSIGLGRVGAAASPAPKPKEEAAPVEYVTEGISKATASEMIKLFTEDRTLTAQSIQNIFSDTSRTAPEKLSIPHIVGFLDTLIKRRLIESKKAGKNGSKTVYRLRSVESRKAEAKPYPQEDLDGPTASEKKSPEEPPEETPPAAVVEEAPVTEQPAEPEQTEPQVKTPNYDAAKKGMKDRLKDRKKKGK